MQLRKLNCARRVAVSCELSVVRSRGTVSRLPHEFRHFQGASAPEGATASTARLLPPPSIVAVIINDTLLDSATARLRTTRLPSRPRRRAPRSPRAPFWPCFTRPMSRRRDSRAERGSLSSPGSLRGPPPKAAGPLRSTTRTVRSARSLVRLRRARVAPLSFAAATCVCAPAVCLRSKSTVRRYIAAHCARKKLWTRPHQAPARLVASAPTAGELEACASALQPALDREWGRAGGPEGGAQVCSTAPMSHSGADGHAAAAAAAGRDDAGAAGASSGPQGSGLRQRGGAGGRAQSHGAAAPSGRRSGDGGVRGAGAAATRVHIVSSTAGPDVFLVRPRYPFFPP